MIFNNPKQELINFAEEYRPNYKDLIQIAGDASFRKYYRIVDKNNISNIIMDAPPEHEDALKFSIIATGFAQTGINVPEIIEADFDNGLLLLSDFGDVQLLSKLKNNEFHYLDLAIDELIVLQKNGGQQVLNLPDYDHNLLLGELGLFSNWFVFELLKEKLTHDEDQLLNELNSNLINYALSQQKTWVHRDYHSRNLMIHRNKIGVIDFQDAVFGPITYDLVSLLKDCYYKLDKVAIEKYLQTYFIKLVSSELIYMSFDDFVKSFDFMGLQRHLKVLGVFSRLSIRDKKHEYLKDLPLTFLYIKEVLERYNDLHIYLPLFSKLEIKLKQKLEQIIDK